MLDKSSTSGQPASISIARRGAIILCGGRSERMGRDKAWLAFGPDEVMLQRAVRLVCEAIPAENVVCVAAISQALPPLPDRVQVVHDKELYGGPLAGLGIGLAAASARSDAVFVTGCDVPLLRPALIARMFECLGDQEIVVPRDGERYYPLAAVYRIGVLTAVELALAAEKRSLTSLIELCRVRNVDVESLRDVDPNLSSFINCNSPDDYRRALLESGFW
jgi:molybdenum cofactor guanylyltransferase